MTLLSQRQSRANLTCAFALICLKAKLTAISNWLNSFYHENLTNIAIQIFFPCKYEAKDIFKAVAASTDPSAGMYIPIEM